jgi:hypothetical protein
MVNQVFSLILKFGSVPYVCTFKQYLSHNILPFCSLPVNKTAKCILWDPLRSVKLITQLILGARVLSYAIFLQP